MRRAAVHGDRRAGDAPAAVTREVRHGRGAPPTAVRSVMQLPVLTSRPNSAGGYLSGSGRSWTMCFMTSVEVSRWTPGRRASSWS
jgi:hypothetical protein